MIAIPNVVTIGMLAKLQFGDDIQMQTSYLQSVYFVLGLTMLVQAFSGKPSAAGCRPCRSLHCRHPVGVGKQQFQCH